MRKFIIFANPSKSMFVTSIAVSSNDITEGILSDPKLAEFYGKNKEYEVLYLDTPEGKEFIRNLLADSQKKYDEAEQVKQRQREFTNKIILAL